MTLTFDVHGPTLTGALARLASIGFSEAGVCRRLGLEDLDDLQLRAIPIYRQERLQERDALAAAIELLLLQGAVPEAELDQLFARPDQEALADAGILQQADGSVRALASLYPVGRALVFSDHAWPQMNQTGYATVPRDQVMGIGTDSRWLARATLRRPVGSALDLCCGSGVHALLAAAHAGQATAVDCNPRAARCFSRACCTPPNRAIARLRASSTAIPRRKFSSTAISRCEAISASRSASSGPLRKNARTLFHPCRKKPITLHRAFCNP